MSTFIASAWPLFIVALVVLAIVAGELLVRNVLRIIHEKTLAVDATNP